MINEDTNRFPHSYESPLSWQLSDIDIHLYVHFEILSRAFKARNETFKPTLTTWCKPEEQVRFNFSSNFLQYVQKRKKIISCE